MKILLKKTFFISIMLILVVFGVAYGNVTTVISGDQMCKELTQALPALECTMDNTNDAWYDDSYDMIYDKRAEN
jgi:hypothetical protein